MDSLYTVGRLVLNQLIDEDEEVGIYSSDDATKIYVNEEEARGLVNHLTKVFELDQDKSSPDTEEPEKVLYHFCIRIIDGGHQSGSFSIDDPHMDTFYTDAKEYIGELCDLSDGEYVILSLNRL